VAIADGEHRVPAGAEPRRLDRVLRELSPSASWNELRRAVTSGKVRVNGAVVTEPARPVGAGDRIEIRMAAPRPRAGQEVSAAAIVYADPHVVVVDKPAGLSTVPYDAADRDTLDRSVALLLARREKRRGAPLGIVHRLDKETSGLLVFARTLAAKRALKQQFRVHSVRRRYLAIVRGRIETSRTVSSRLVRDRGDGRRGSTDNPKLGRLAITHVRPLQPLGDATLIECTLETGRTHQIRIHLSEAGHPLLGERVYATESQSAPRVMLHAAELGFVHPATGRPLDFSSEPPADFRALVAALLDPHARKAIPDASKVRSVLRTQKGQNQATSKRSRSG
jgi:23S rRNA pseudouridine1911/1915/1917 synthase